MKFYALLFLTLFAFGCATTEDKDAAAESTPPTPEEVAAVQSTSKPAAKESDLNDNETDMAHLPIEMNEKVTKWIEYFQGRGREHMVRHLARSSRYLPKMKEILLSHNLPEDLVYIALIESGFNAQALSSANAVGYWQFIRGTGRRYGLQQNYYVDDRRDFIASTDAAANYLKALYNLFGSWYLAIASYNVGENRIKNVVMKHYTRNFWELAQKDGLPPETTNYVPKFLAARLIAKHPEKYGFDDVVYEPPLDFKEFTLDGKGVNIKKMAENIGVNFAELSGLNPSFKRGIIPKGQTKAKLRVPPHIEDTMILAALDKSDSKITVDVIASGDGETYVIRRGDTLSHIAQRFGTSIRAIRDANNMVSRTVLYPGKKILVPTGRTITAVSATTTKANASAAAPAAAEVPVTLQAGEQKYVVQEGDSLYTISQKFNVQMDQIKSRNNLGRKSLINIDTVLVIPAKEGAGAGEYPPGSAVQKAMSTVASQIVHIVSQGETLFEIAQKYNTTIAALTQANNLKARTELAIGHKLVIPGTN